MVVVVVTKATSEYHCRTHFEIYLEENGKKKSETKFLTLVDAANMGFNVKLTPMGEIVLNFFVFFFCFS